MIRMSFADAEYSGKRKKTLREVFLKETDRHPFRVIKRRIRLMKVRFRRLQTNTGHLLAVPNLWMARRQLMGPARPKMA